MFNTSDYNKDFRTRSKSIMLSKIEELEIRVGELVKENHELREAGERLAKENIEKHFALKKHAECNYKLMKEKEALQKELKKLKGNKLFLLDDEGVPIKSFTLTGKLTLMEEPAKEKLERNKWYRASDFDIDELKEKLGLGVLVEVIRHPTEDKDEMRPELREVRTERVHFILKNRFGKTALSTGSAFYRNWFRVI